jgi:flagellar motility protein MotE (MotC chaperone)
MKFLLVPLLIVGMFVSFTAALLAMLFFTKTIKSPEELQKIISGQVDSTRISDEFIDPQDRLGDLIRELDDYQELYQTQLKRNEAVAESLATVEARVLATKADVDQRQAAMDSLSQGEQSRLRRDNLKSMAAFYSKVKAQNAAEIFQEGTFQDTSVAMLMRLLPPQQMAKIMQAMTPDFAANITKMMEELKQDEQQQ